MHHILSAKLSYKNLKHTTHRLCTICLFIYLFIHILNVNDSLIETQMLPRKEKKKRLDGLSCEYSKLPFSTLAII